MANHANITSFVNGYRISVAIDDNLCKRFRYEILVFHKEPSGSLESFSESYFGGSMQKHGRDLQSMSQDILDLTKTLSELPPGKIVQEEDCAANVIP